MKLPAFLLLLSCGQAAAQPPAAVAPLEAEDENRSVLAAVLTQELQEAGAKARNICIRPALSPALEDARRRRAQNCGDLCGGSLLALQRIGGRWTPIAFINTWIS